MKFKLLPLITIVITTLATMCASCSSDKNAEQEYLDYLNSEQYKKDLDNLFYFGALKQNVMCLVIQAGTNNFTAHENDTIDFGNNKYKYWITLHDIMGTLQEHEKEFKESVRRLDYMRVFDVATPQLDSEGNVVAMGNYGPDPMKCTDPESRAMALLATPAQAAPPMLFIQAFYEFFNTPSELAIESRKTVITVAARLSDADRKTIFEHLDKSNKAGETDYKKWWNNFNDGKYDVKAHRVWRDIIAQSDTPAKTNYLSVADDLDILNEKQFMSAAGKLVTRGAKLQVEIINKVVGSSTSSYNLTYGAGEKVGTVTVSYDNVYGTLDNINNTVGMVDSIRRGTVTMNDAQDYAIGTIKNIVNDELQNVSLILPGDKKIPLDNPHVGGGEFVDMSQVAWNELKKSYNAYTGKDKVNLVWGTDEERAAQINVMSKDGKPTDMVVVRDKNTGALFAVKTKEVDEKTMSIVVPGGGDYTVTAIGEDGNKQTVTGVKVDHGKSVDLSMTKNERETFEKLLEHHQKNDSDADFMKWLRGFRERWAEKKQKEQAEKEAKEKAEQEAKEKEKQEEAKAKAEQEAKDKALDEEIKKEEEAKKAAEAKKVAEAADAQKAANVPFSLVGRWKIVDVKVSGTLANQVPEAAIKGQIQEFKANGSYTLSSQRGSGLYHYKGGSTITMDGHSYTFKQLSPDRIQITYTESYTEGGKKQNLVSVMTLVKISESEPAKTEPKKPTTTPAQPKATEPKATTTSTKKKTYRHAHAVF